MAGNDTANDPVPVPAPDPVLLARFAADLAGVWPAPATARLGLAVSGGPDSLALLLLAHGTRPGAVAAATVDHGLRPEAADEAAYVARICERLGVPHATLAVNVAVTAAGGNVQAGARAARYAALAGWMGKQDITALATAHHVDDQAETLLLRLNRGSGVAGLAGVRTRGRLPGSAPEPAMVLVRPLLGWRRAELAAVVAGAGLVAVADPSNHDDRYDRARLRGQMAQVDWLDAAALARSAAHLADADAALDWAAAREWQECVSRDGPG